MAKGQGDSTGLITTARVTHATPAGCSVHVKDRDNEDEIAAQYLELQPDVILGGGSRHFGSATRGDGQETFMESSPPRDIRLSGRRKNLRHSRDQECSARSAIRACPRKSIAAIRESKARAWPISPGRASTCCRLRPEDSSSRSKLDESTTPTTEQRSRSHAVGRAGRRRGAGDILDFTDRNPGTLLILGSDHGTGGGAIYGIGTEYQRSSTSFDRMSSEEHPTNTSSGSTGIVAAGLRHRRGGTNLPGTHSPTGKGRHHCRRHPGASPDRQYRRLPRTTGQLAGLRGCRRHEFWPTLTT